jgi:hypothetical protein
MRLDSGQEGSNIDWEWLSSREEDEVGYHWNRLASPGANPLGTLLGTTHRYLYGVLGAEGVSCDLQTLDDGRPCLLARLPGSEPGNALVLLAATDPPAGEPPSSRKALEGVSLAVGAWAAMAIARRRRWTLRRDLILVATSVGSSVGSMSAIRHRIRDPWPLHHGIELSVGVGSPQ